MFDKVAILLCCLLVLQASAKTSWEYSNLFSNGYGVRSLLKSSRSSSGAQANGNKSGVKARSRVKVTSTGGTIIGRSSANAEASASARDAIARACSSAVAAVKAGQDASAVAEAEATAVATAIAKAYAAAFVEIISDSKTAEGCGESNAEASASATAFAQVFVSAIAEADNRINYADAEAEAEAISVGTAQAFTNADASACLVGKGRATALQESLARAIVKPYASALVRALAFVTGSNGGAGDNSGSEVEAIASSNTKDVSESQGTSVAEVEGNGTANAEGKAVTQTTQITNKCPREFIICCKTRRSTCQCRSGCSAVQLKDLPTGLAYRVTKPSRSRRNPIPSGYECLCA